MRGLAFAIVIGAGLSFPAEAGPWTRQKGAGYAQAAILGQNIDGVGAVRGELYGEYGVTSKWTLNAQLEGVTFPELAGLRRSQLVILRIF